MPRISGHAVSRKLCPSEAAEDFRAMRENLTVTKPNAMIPTAVRIQERKVRSLERCSLISCWSSILFFMWLLDNCIVHAEICPSRPTSLRWWQSKNSVARFLFGTIARIRGHISGGLWLLSTASWNHYCWHRTALEAQWPRDCLSLKLGICHNHSLIFCSQAVIKFLGPDGLPAVEKYFLREQRSFCLTSDQNMQQGFF